MQLSHHRPDGLKQMHLQAVDRSTPYRMEYQRADAGKTAYYARRWPNTRDEQGPWSATFSATISR